MKISKKPGSYLSRVRRGDSIERIDSWFFYEVLKYFYQKFMKRIFCDIQIEIIGVTLRFILRVSE